MRVVEQGAERDLAHDVPQGHAEAPGRRVHGGHDFRLPRALGARDDHRQALHARVVQSQAAAELQGRVVGRRGRGVGGVPAQAEGRVHQARLVHVARAALGIHVARVALCVTPGHGRFVHDRPPSGDVRGALGVPLRREAPRLAGLEVVRVDVPVDVAAVGPHDLAAADRRVGLIGLVRGEEARRAGGHVVHGDVPVAAAVVLVDDLVALGGRVPLVARAGGHRRHHVPEEREDVPLSGGAALPGHALVPPAAPPLTTGELCVPRSVDTGVGTAYGTAASAVGAMTSSSATLVRMTATPGV